MSTKHQKSWVLRVAKKHCLFKCFFKHWGCAQWTSTIYILNQPRQQSFSTCLSLAHRTWNKISTQSTRERNFSGPNQTKYFSRKRFTNTDRDEQHIHLKYILICLINIWTFYRKDINYILKYKKVIALQVLCILISQQVLRMPFAGWNNPILSLRSISSYYSMEY